MPPPQLFDVFVIGPATPGPQAEAQLAATLAAQSGRTVETITQALARKNLRVAHKVAKEAADNVARQLQTLGAATSVTPALAGGTHPLPRTGGTGAGPAPTLPPAPGFAPLGTPASSTQRGLAPAAHATPAGRPAPPGSPAGFTLTPLSGTSALRANPPSSPNLAPPPSGNFRLTDPDSGALPAPARAAIGGGMAPAFAPAPQELAEAPLELARPLPAPKAAPAPSTSISSTSLSSLGKPAYTVAGASGLNTSKIVATSSKSGLALSDEDEAHTERCRTHGLLFDRRKSKGCRRCVANRRSANPADEARSRLRDSPTKRAFAAFGLSLLIGFGVAAYYAKNPGAAEVDRLRAEQAELSERAGTEAVVRRFDQIDGLVSASQNRTIRNTLFIWVATGGIVMVAFYRAT